MMERLTSRAEARATTPMLKGSSGDVESNLVEPIRTARDAPQVLYEGTIPGQPREYARQSVLGCQEDLRDTRQEQNHDAQLPSPRQAQLSQMHDRKAKDEHVQAKVTYHRPIVKLYDVYVTVYRHRGNPVSPDGQALDDSQRQLQSRRESVSMINKRHIYGI